MFRADAEPKIYRLHNERLNISYYGSTIRPIEKRFNDHKSRARLENNCSSKRLFQEGDDVTCEVVEYVDCLDKETLHKRERYYIENFDCVNKLIPNRTKAEYYQDNKETKKEYANEYYHNNKERKQQYHYENYQNNKDKIKEYQKDNEEKIRERRSQRIQCECGKIVSRCNIAVHRKTKRHQDLMIK